MKTSISNNSKTITILNKLIENGYYKGTIEKDKFELTSTCPNHFMIKGTLNNSNKFDLKQDESYTMIYLKNFIFSIGSIVSIVLVAIGNWFPLVAFIIISLFLIASSKLGERKIIKLFLDKYFEIEKREDDK
jgi:hypothetical protein